jgi:chemotaxis protein methyltransferase CheR
VALPLSSQVFTITAHLLAEKTGLQYRPADREPLAEKLSERAAELGLGSLLDYYYYLRYDEGAARELSTLVDMLVVQETYLFREADPLRVIARRIVPELLQRGERVRMWCAACATGEEPYTLAMLLAETGLLGQVEILASDISDRGLERARRGIYAGRSLRNLSAGASPAHLIEDAPGQVRVSETLRRAVTFCRVNLVEETAVRALGTFHLILCRNALIYFSEATVAQVARTLSDALMDDGLLVVGASESLLRFGTLLVCEERDGAFFYRRRRE